MSQPPTQLRAWTIDARGTPRRVQATVLTLWPALSFPARGLLVLSIIALIAAIVVPFFTDIVIGPAPPITGYQWYLWLFPVFLAFNILMQVRLGLVRAEAADRIAADHLRRGRCPSYVYSLKGCPRATDGTMTCPECGGVWMIPQSSSQKK